MPRPNPIHRERQARLRAITLLLMDDDSVALRVSTMRSKPKNQETTKDQETLEDQKLDP